MPATPAKLDMTKAGLKPNGKPIIDPQGRPPEKQGGRPAKSMSPKQIRARARRRQKIVEEELAQLYKPIEEWDAEELARGRPRAADGSFKGKAPEWINRAVHEQVVRQFEKIVRSEMNAHTVEALSVIQRILENDDTDDKGKPLVPASTKLDAAKFLIEHVIGKPKQRVEGDISVRLQAMLGHAMVNPSPQGGYELTQGFVEAESWEGEEDERGNEG